MLITIIIWITLIVSEAYEDAKMKFIDHSPGFINRIVIFILTVFLFSNWMNLSWYEMAEFGFILTTIFWFVFEISTNLFRGNGLLYIGNTSKIDKILNGYEFPIFCFRVFLIGLSLMIYYNHNLIFN